MNTKQVGAFVLLVPMLIFFLFGCASEESEIATFTDEESGTEVQVKRTTAHPFLAEYHHLLVVNWKDGSTASQSMLPDTGTGENISLYSVGRGSFFVLGMFDAYMADAERKKITVVFDETTGRKREARDFPPSMELLGWFDEGPTRRWEFRNADRKE